MKQLAYALLVVALLLSPGVAADSEREPEQETPCDWFEWWLEPSPGADVDLQCLIDQLPI